MKIFCLISFALVGLYGLEAQKFQEVLKGIPQKMDLVAVLTDKLKESSGPQYTQKMIYDLLMTVTEMRKYINSVNPSGNIIQSVQLINAKNKDWENIACDGRYLYMSDKGNNLGHRKDLVIYKIDTRTIGKEAKTDVSAEKIYFYYPEQTSLYYRDPYRMNNFDREGFDKLHFFKKQWGSYLSAHYTLPVTAGEYSTKK